MCALVVLLAAGCYPKKKGKELEQWAKDQYEWSLQIYNQVIVPLYDGSGPLPAQIVKIKEDLLKLCKDAGIPAAQCDADFKPGPGDTATPPPPKKYPPD